MPFRARSGETPDALARTLRERVGEEVWSAISRCLTGDNSVDARVLKSFEGILECTSSSDLVIEVSDSLTKYMEKKDLVSRMADFLSGVCIDLAHRGTDPMPAVRKINNGEIAKVILLHSGDIETATRLSFDLVYITASATTGRLPGLTDFPQEYLNFLKEGYAIPFVKALGGDLWKIDRALGIAGTLSDISGNSSLQRELIEAIGRYENLPSVASILAMNLKEIWNMHLQSQVGMPEDKEGIPDHIPSEDYLAIIMKMSEEPMLEAFMKYSDSPGTAFVLAHHIFELLLLLPEEWATGRIASMISSEQFARTVKQFETEGPSEGDKTTS